MQLWEINFLLESLAACHDVKSKLEMHFIVKTAFVNYLDNLTESLKCPILLSQTTHIQTYQFLHILLFLFLIY